MLIDNAIKEFTEKYDREAIASIDKISKNIGLVQNNHTLKLFNLKESIDQFASFIKGYGEYRKVYKESAEISSMETIRNDFNRALPKFFEQRDIRYNELPDFVHAYIKGVNTLLETVDTVKADMMENDIELEYVAAVNDFVDGYFGKLQESFNDAMDRILWASGYNAHQRLVKRGNKSVSTRPVFL